VFGRENRWHVFIDGSMGGKRVTVRLVYETQKGKRVPVNESADIDIPLDDRVILSLLAGEADRKIYELSEAESRWKGGSYSFLSS
jgi:hypothetical protein